MPPKNITERDIFGSGSELSSDEEDNIPDNRHVSESSGEDSQDEYQQETPQLKKRTKKVRAERKTTTKKRKHQPPPEINLEELTPEEASKRRVDMEIDAILKPKKPIRSKKRKANEEVLDSFADDEVARMREAMSNAADEDIRANEEKLPAIAKLRLLSEAMETLRKQSLAQSMVDNNLLEAVKRWLEPLPDKSLPALNVQRELFGVIKKMEFIDSAVLKESGLGRIVLFYTKCKRVTPDISRIANELVSTWSRPIIKRSASYRDRVIPVAELPDVHRGGERLSAILARTADPKRVRKNAVAIPTPEIGHYAVAPDPNMGLRNNTSVDVDIIRRRNNADKLRMLTRRVAGTKPRDR